MDKNAKKELKWYDAADLPPPNTPRIIVWSKMHGIFIAKLWNDMNSDDPTLRGETMWYDAETINSDNPTPAVFTHWMHMPDAPN